MSSIVKNRENLPILGLIGGLVLYRVILTYYPSALVANLGLFGIIGFLLVVMFYSDIAARLKMTGRMAIENVYYSRDGSPRILQMILESEGAIVLEGAARCTMAVMGHSVERTWIFFRCRHDPIEDLAPEDEKRYGKPIESFLAIEYTGRKVLKFGARKKGAIVNGERVDAISEVITSYLQPISFKEAGNERPIFAVRHASGFFADGMAPWDPALESLTDQQLEQLASESGIVMLPKIERDLGPHPAEGKVK